MPSLFISYRRGDSPDTVKLIHERLKRRLPRWEIFYDHESIPLGEQFPERLRVEVTSAAVVLVIIGPKWLDVLHERRSADIDHVREEVKLALSATPNVVPILVGHAKMPTDTDLADFKELQPLLQRNGRPVRADPDFDRDLEAIVSHLKQFDSDEAIGATLDDKYTLTAEIARGGMGVVYLAEQKQPVKRKVAVKLIKPGMDSREVLARFDAERQALAVMDHPNIAKVYDAGMTAQGRPFFVMEYVKGVPITQYCDEKKLSPQERLNLFIPVCNAVQHAHQKGIIHRDIKPSNVLVEVVDGKPIAKVIDFGLAKALGHKLTDLTQPPTALDIRIGTLEYSAPEQAAGRIFDVDTRSDIYSIGVLLYELLTGAPPFTHEELLKIGEEEMRRAIREDEPTKPSKKLSSSGQLPAIAANRQLAPNKLTRLLQGDIDWIVMKCLEKERDRRYKNANDIGEELQRFLANEPVLAGPPSAAYRLRKFVRRHKAGLLSTAAVLLAVMLAAGGVGWAAWDRVAKEAERREELAGRMADTEKAVMVALAKAQQSEERARLMECATSVEAKAALAVWWEAEAFLAEAEATITTGVATDTLLERVAVLRQRFATERMKAERNEHLFKNLDDARMTMVTRKGLNFDHAAAAVKYAAAFEEIGLEVQSGQAEIVALRIHNEVPAVRESLIVALDYWAFCAERPMKMRLLAIAQAADQDAWRRNYRHTVEQRDVATLLQLSKDARRLSLPPISIESLAMSLYENKERDEVRDMLRWARGLHPNDFWIAFLLAEILDKQTVANPVEQEEMIGCLRVAMALRPDASAPRNRLGVALVARNQLDEAIAEYKKAIALEPKESSDAHYNLGLALRAKNQTEDAISEYKKAIALNPNFAQAHDSLGVALASKNQRDQAIAEFKKAIELDSRLAMAHFNLGNSLSVKNQQDEAIAEFKKAIELDPKHAGAHSNLGFALSAKDRVVEAIAEFKKAIDLDPKEATAHYNLGNALKHTNRVDEAIAEYKKAVALNPQNASPHLMLGNILANKKQLDDAIAEYNQAIALEPKSSKAHYNLGVLLSEKNQLDEAIAEFKKAIELEPKDLIAQHNLGVILKRNATAHYNLGTALASKNQVNEAVAEYKKAIDLDPKHVKARYQLGLTLYDRNQLDEAFAEFKKVIELEPKDARAHHHLGRVLYAKKQLDDAIAEYRKAIALDPKYEWAYISLGNALFDSDQLDEAIVAYKKAIDLDPKDYQAHFNLGRALAEMNRQDEAIAEYKKVIDINPKFAGAYYDLGNVLFRQSRFAQAEDSFQRCLELRSSSDPRRKETEKRIKRARSFTELEKKLPSILSGETKPTDTAELLEVAELCQLKQLNVAGARFFALVMADKPSLTDDLNKGHSYNAACCAVLAAAGKGNDADMLPDQERVDLRKQALHWLQADLASWGKLLDKEGDNARPIVQSKMTHWKKDTDLADMRNTKALERLPPDERDAWQKLWKDVDTLLAKAQEKK